MRMGYAKLIKEFGGSIIVRVDGRIEWVCKHGVGHTLGRIDRKKTDFIHGCDGCCKKVKEYTHGK